LYDPHFKIFRYAIRGFLVRILATKYYARGRKNFPAKKLSIWFLAGKFFLPSPSNFPTFSSLAATTPPTSRRSRSSSYQMSLLLPVDPGTRWTRTAEPWVVGPSSYPLDLIERTILILELRDGL